MLMRKFTYLIAVICNLTILQCPPKLEATKVTTVDIEKLATTLIKQIPEEVGLNPKRVSEVEELFEKLRESKGEVESKLRSVIQGQDPKKSVQLVSQLGLGLIKQIKKLDAEKKELEAAKKEQQK